MKILRPLGQFTERSSEGGTTLGFYISHPDGNPDGDAKAAYLVAEHGARQVDSMQAWAALDDPSVGVICVKGYAAVFIYNKKEFAHFNKPDFMPKLWYIMDRKTAEQLSGFDR